MYESLYRVRNKITLVITRMRFTRNTGNGSRSRWDDSQKGNPFQEWSRYVCVCVCVRLEVISLLHGTIKKKQYSTQNVIIKILRP